MTEIRTQLDDRIRQIDDGLLDMIDVVNEPLHSTPSYKEALGGDGVTGWDWVVTVFEMAMSYFPNAILMVNDYNILNLDQNTNNYLPVIAALQERGLIDAIGVQGHFLEQADPIPIPVRIHHCTFGYPRRRRNVDG